jgi:hypothetical protein
MTVILLKVALIIMTLTLIYIGHDVITWNHSRTLLLIFQITASNPKLDLLSLTHLSPATKSRDTEHWTQDTDRRQPKQNTQDWKLNIRVKLLKVALIIMTLTLIYIGHDVITWNHSRTIVYVNRSVTVLHDGQWKPICWKSVTFYDGNLSKTHKTENLI